MEAHSSTDTPQPATSHAEAGTSSKLVPVRHRLKLYPHGFGWHRSLQLISWDNRERCMSALRQRNGRDCVHLQVHWPYQGDEVIVLYLTDRETVDLFGLKYVGWSKPGQQGRYVSLKFSASDHPDVPSVLRIHHVPLPGWLKQSQIKFRNLRHIVRYTIPERTFLRANKRLRHH